MNAMASSCQKNDAARAGLAQALEGFYEKYNRRELVSPDPLELLFQYDDLYDREIAGLIASSLAYGGVKQIVRSVSTVLEKMGPSPRDFLDSSSPQTLKRTFAHFKHRFTDGESLAGMLCGVKRAIEVNGSLQACFLSSMNPAEQTVVDAIAGFVTQLTAVEGGEDNYLLPSPVKGSACKRLNLFLRWMVRQDDVDPGGWDAVGRHKLVIPLDTHMHAIGLALGLTERRQANLATALEITGAFRALCPDDPVRYDFALTRIGMRGLDDVAAFVKQSNGPGEA